MRIGLRTIKTALSATLALLLAEAFHLLYPTAAGIIALLSVTNSKRSSLITGLSRLASLALATAIAYLCFTFIGFNAWAFGVYLLLFIPATVYFKLSEGISVSSVLVTHYLIEQDLSWQIIANEFALMILGVGFALLFNLYMPDREKKIKENQLIIETLFKKVLEEMADSLEDPEKETQLLTNCQNIRKFIQESSQEAQIQMENRWLAKDSYYLDYFNMRRLQSNFLKDMIELLEKTTIELLQSKQIRDVLLYTADHLAEENDGQENLNKIAEVYDSYRTMELPQSREEFENRARLFQFLQLFETFIEIKADFYAQQTRS
ncbi:aromatic acid exporter family protein [Enterococcus asini]|uniref:aromatic acid exporter family protein n=1 Tax=Enterococcus asini TaxID=57732 RepID=UPI0028905489|nr:aromatic acid exporter family protein [Enterococcus asini]MDT2757522.1 aromatic acid exporter family protein [Enterococcus asini]